MNRSFWIPLAAILAIGMIACEALRAQADVFDLPLDQKTGWQFLQYRNIPPNAFRPTPAGLEIDVARSAGPAVFPLDHPLLVTELRVSGKITGSLTIPPGKQGEKGFDDYAIRVGLVEAGSRTLSWSERLVSADWVKKLFALAPAGTGISRIHFFNVGSHAKQIGRTRTHPLSDLMEETVVAVPDSEGKFAFTERLARPMKVLALWIACDGDDTHSSFTVKVDRLELKTQPMGAGTR